MYESLYNTGLHNEINISKYLHPTQVTKHIWSNLYSIQTYIILLNLCHSVCKQQQQNGDDNVVYTSYQSYLRNAVRISVINTKSTSPRPTAVLCFVSSEHVPSVKCNSLIRDVFMETDWQNVTSETVVPTDTWVFFFCPFPFSGTGHYPEMALNQARLVLLLSSPDEWLKDVVGRDGLNALLLLIQNTCFLLQCWNQ